MELAAYGASLLLAAVFVAAAVGKLADRQETAVGFGRLGLPASSAMATVVPVAELTTALALALVPVAGGVLAIVVLGSFTGFLADRVNKGVAEPCRCLGGTSTRPVSWEDVLRNGAFLAVALIVVLFGPTTAPFLP
ncbi:hypothetical protein B7486_56375 [cyanobacterium TDX16]|nr:hypothetical protein B7486_56375 [cyanobacterium TDX16]